ncbi:hypothetical protein GA0061096_2674 [Fictibacillus enclensis]|uniref:Uncharacterized protein n=1 Tax=Fictibacillus enclensis TaxID=1017270 RepID=A0A0V8J8W7_9BACL|nr:hypothetical protein [Fictibacillus enclensis]KSU83419.1 hypothetical protein AS030_12705 [Fictibacillus enclensis]SCC15200.1 hypothetical protein GA0061096_2674 [Fictibacillus enclensis]
MPRKTRRQVTAGDPVNIRKKLSNKRFGRAVRRIEGECASGTKEQRKSASIEYESTATTETGEEKEEQ